MMDLQMDLEMDLQMTAWSTSLPTSSCLLSFPLCPIFPTLEGKSRGEALSPSIELLSVQLWAASDELCVLKNVFAVCICDDTWQASAAWCVFGGCLCIVGEEFIFRLCFLWFG